MADGNPELQYKMPVRTLLLVAAAGMASSMHAGPIIAEIAGATISSTQIDPTDWQYNLTPTDTGTADNRHLLFFRGAGGGFYGGRAD
jgi:hypothetical protein